MAVPTWIAEAPATRNSIASSAVAMPPIPTTGASIARATSRTIRRASGLMHGPESPPTPRPRTGARRFQSIAMPTYVLITLTQSAPALTAACAMGRTSVTLGDSFAIRGRPVLALTLDTTARAASGEVE